MGRLDAIRGVPVRAYSANAYAAAVVSIGSAPFYSRAADVAPYCIKTSIAPFVDITLPVHQIVVADVAPTPNHSVHVIDSP